MFIPPLLPILYQQDNLTKATVKYICDNRYIYWASWSNSAYTGKRKVALGYRTKGFTPGKTWVCHPWDVRLDEGLTSPSSGYVYEGWTLYPTWVWSNQCVSTTMCNSFESFVGTSASFSQAEIDEAITRLLSKINTPDVDYGLILAEMQETLSMIANPLNGIRKILKEIFRRRRLPKNTAQHVAGQWLELRYGILPLISDINSIINGATERIAREVYRKSLKQVLSANQSVVQRDWFGGYDGPYGVNFRGYMESSQSRTVTGKGYYRPIVNFCSVGLSFTDIPATLWEIVPFSFVVDWFISVGDWIRAMTPDYRLDVISNCITFSEEKKVDYVVTHAKRWGDPDSYALPVIGDKYTTRNFRCYRLVDVQLPDFPPVNWSSLGLLRSMDSISLMWQKTAKYLR